MICEHVQKSIMSCFSTVRARMLVGKFVHQFCLRHLPTGERTCGHVQFPDRTGVLCIFEDVVLPVVVVVVFHQIGWHKPLLQRTKGHYTRFIPNIANCKCEISDFISQHLPVENGTFITCHRTIREANLLHSLFVFFLHSCCQKSVHIMGCCASGAPVGRLLPNHPGAPAKM